MADLTASTSSSSPSLPAASSSSSNAPALVSSESTPLLPHSSTVAPTSNEGSSQRWWKRFGKRGKGEGDGITANAQGHPSQGSIGGTFTTVGGRSSSAFTSAWWGRDRWSSVWALAATVLSCISAVFSSLALVGQDWIHKADYRTLQLSAEWGLWQLCGVFNADASVLCKAYSETEDLKSIFFVSLDTDSRNLLNAAAAFGIFGFAANFITCMCLLLGYLRSHVRSKRIGFVAAIVSAVSLLLTASFMGGLSSHDCILPPEASGNGKVNWTFGLCLIAMFLMLLAAVAARLDLVRNLDFYIGQPDDRPWAPLLTKLPILAHLVVAMAVCVDSNPHFGYNVLTFVACLFAVYHHDDHPAWSKTALALLAVSILLDCVTLGLYGSDVLQSGTYMERFAFSGTIISLIFKPVTLFFLWREMRQHFSNFLSSSLPWTFSRSGGVSSGVGSRSVGVSGSGSGVSSGGSGSGGGFSRWWKRGSGGANAASAPQSSSGAGVTGSSQPPPPSSSSDPSSFVPSPSAANGAKAVSIDAVGVAPLPSASTSSSISPASSAGASAAITILSAPRPITSDKPAARRRALLLARAAGTAAGSSVIEAEVERNEVVEDGKKSGVEEKQAGGVVSSSLPASLTMARATATTVTPTATAAPVLPRSSTAAPAPLTAKPATGLPVVAEVAATDSPPVPLSSTSPPATTSTTITTTIIPSTTTSISPFTAPAVSMETSRLRSVSAIMPPGPSRAADGAAHPDKPPPPPARPRSMTTTPSTSAISNNTSSMTSSSNTVGGQGIVATRAALTATSAQSPTPSSPPPQSLSSQISTTSGAAPKVESVSALSPSSTVPALLASAEPTLPSPLPPTLTSDNTAPPVHASSASLTTSPLAMPLPSLSSPTDKSIDTLAVPAAASPSSSSSSVISPIPAPISTTTTTTTTTTNTTTTASLTSPEPAPTLVSDSELFGGADILDGEEDNTTTSVTTATGSKSKKSRKGAAKKAAAEAAAAAAAKAAAEEEEELRRLRAEAAQRNAERVEALAKAQQAEEEVLRRAAREQAMENKADIGKEGMDTLSAGVGAGASVGEKATKAAALSSSPAASSTLLKAASQNPTSPTQGKSRASSFSLFSSSAPTPPSNLTTTTTTTTATNNTNNNSGSASASTTANGTSSTNTTTTTSTKQKELRHTSAVADSDATGYTCKECGMVFADMIIAQIHRNAAHAPQNKE